MRKVLPIDRERRVPLLIINVEIDRIGRNLVFAQAFNNLIRSLFRIIGVPALLVAQRPEWRKRRSACQRSVVLNDFLWRRSGKVVVVELAAVGTERIVVTRLLSKIK